MEQNYWKYIKIYYITKLLELRNIYPNMSVSENIIKHCWVRKHRCRILCPYNLKGYVTVSRVLGVVSQIHAEHLFADPRCITEYLSIYIVKYLRVERYTIWANRVPRRDLQLITLNLCSFMALDSPKYITTTVGDQNLKIQWFRRWIK